MPSIMRGHLLAFFCACSVVLRPSLTEPITSSTTYLGTGYDLSIGNPEGEDLFNGGLDPGLKPTSQVLVVSDNNKDGCPKEATCTRLEMTVLHKDLVDDMAKYQQQLQRNWVLDEDEDTVESSASSLHYRHARGSKTTEQVREVVEKKGDVLVAKQEWDVHAEASYKYRSYHTLDSEFIEDVCSLPAEFSNETRSVYFNFLRTWGTHVIVQVRLGRKVIERNRYAKDDYLSYLLNQHSMLNVSTVTVDRPNRIEVVSASSRLSTAHVQEIVRGLESIQGEVSPLRSFGSRLAPVPLYSHMEDLSFFVSKNYIGVNTTACPHIQNDAGLEKLHNSIEEAIREYLKPNADQEFAPTVERTLRLSLLPTNIWPSGAYAFLKPNTGCPSMFESGTRRHDLEDRSRETAFSNGLSGVLAGTFEQDVVLAFCVKNVPSAGDVHWALGSYCLLKKHDCPSGFSLAEAYLDDEDSDNRNKIEGVVPDGTYNQDTRYQFCCRKDGASSAPIYLPTREPFVLFPENSAKICQKVDGMRSTLHWITFDTEGIRSSVSGANALPYFESGGNLKLYLCYYVAV